MLRPSLSQKKGRKMVTIESLEKELKENKLNSIYLLYGEELFLLENSLNKIRKIFGECIKGINYILIDETNLNRLVSELETPAFGYERKLIIVRNSGLLKKEGKRKNQELAKLRENFVEYIKENIELIKQSIILVIIEEDVDTKQEAFKVIEKYATVCEFKPQNPMQLEKRLKAICNRV